MLLLSRQFIFVGIFIFFNEMLYELDPIIICISWSLCLYSLYYFYKKVFQIEVGFSPIDFRLINKSMPTWLASSQCFIVYLFYGLVMNIVITTETFGTNTVKLLVLIIVPLFVMKYLDKSNCSAPI